MLSKARSEPIRNFFLMFDLNVIQLPSLRNLQRAIYYSKSKATHTSCLIRILNASVFSLWQSRIPVAILQCVLRDHAEQGTFTIDCCTGLIHFWNCRWRTRDCSNVLLLSSSKWTRELRRLVIFCHLSTRCTPLLCQGQKPYAQCSEQALMSF